MRLRELGYCGNMRDRSLPTSEKALVQSAQIHGCVVRRLEAYLKRRDISLDELARKVGDPFPFQIAATSWYFPLSDFSSLLERASRDLGDAYLGLRCGQSDEPPVMHPLLMALRYAPNLRQGLEVLVTYHRTLIDLSVNEMRNLPKGVEVVWQLSPVVTLQNQLIDFIAVAFRSRLAKLMQEDGVRFSEFRLSRRRPAQVRTYQRYFGPNVTFEAERNGVLIPNVVADRPNPNADPCLFEALVELCQRRLADRGSFGGIGAIVQERIAGRISDTDLSLDGVAKSLGMSSRALQRRLSEAGITFQELYDMVRRDMSSDLLLNSDLAISEIAFRLGFSAVGNYTRAAKRWYGESPSTWRQKQEH